MAEKATQELERIYTIPLRLPKSSPRNHRSDRAVRFVKAYLQKHMKSENVWIDPSVNGKLWDHGMYSIPSRIRVRAVKFDDGVVEVSLPEVEVKASIRAELKERREKAEAEKAEKGKKKEEAKPAEEAGKAEGEKAGEKPAEKPAEKAKPAAAEESAAPKSEADKARAGPAKAEPETKAAAKSPARSEKGSA